MTNKLPEPKSPHNSPQDFPEGEDFAAQLQYLHDHDMFREIIEAIEALPAEARDYELTCQLARAYNNRAVMDIGRQEGAPLLERSLELLASLADQGQEDPLWHFRRGYALYYLDREEEALQSFREAARLDPADPDAPMFIRRCQEILEAPDEPDLPLVYSREEMAALEAHIEAHFGHFGNVLHEIVSPDIHVDICLIPPHEDHNYQLLVTMGMGAAPMNVPPELAEYRLERAEVMIALPPDWRLDEEALQDENWYWPIRLLKSTARLPLNDATWLGWGHTIGLGEGDTYAENTSLCGTVLVSPQRVEEEFFCCPLPGGDEVNFYQLIPLYKEEIAYKLANSTEDLLEHMAGISFVVDPRRPAARLPEPPLFEEAPEDAVDAYPHFLELQLNARFQPRHRHELEDALEEALEHLDLGTVSGGGTLTEPTGEVKSCDIELKLKNIAPPSLDKLCSLLNHLGIPKGSRLCWADEEDEDHIEPLGRQEGLALYLNGTALPDEVYAQCDINELISRLEELLGPAGRLYSWWEGPEETALYFYGDSFAQMQEAMAGLLAAHPLCQKCRVVQIS